MSTVISIENVSKAYHLGQIGGGTLKEDVSRWWAKLRRKPDPHLKVGQEHHVRKMGELFWALDNVSFNIEEGQVLGVIGRNGAGKSTLLKILSQVTTPTSGQIKIKGRIASLLEVGTGFHPELTGKENIFLNGAILGMTKSEIRSKFDEIVAFSGVEEFVDTPVKRYSSGMYVRLAFAVAAHLEPEILIVDEVLAVGDAEFQRKCLGKMKDVSKTGRTILFVSHNMHAVVSLCNTAVWLQDGKMVAMGNPRVLADKYGQSDSIDEIDNDLPLLEKPRTGSGAARFSRLEFHAVNGSGAPEKRIITGSNVVFRLEIISERSLKASNVAITIYDRNNYRVVDVNTALKGEFLSLPPGAKASVVFRVEELLLKPGDYIVELWLGRGGGVEDIDFVKNASVMTVHEDIVKANHAETFPGIYQCKFTHEIQSGDNRKPE